MATNTTGSDTGEENQISVREAEDYVEQRRQKEIMDLARKVIEIDQMTDSEHNRGEIDLATRQAELRTAVTGLIFEIQHMANDVGADWLFRGEPFYTVEIAPPRDLLEIVEDSDFKVWGTEDLEPKTVYTIRGIGDYRNAPSTFTATWTVNADIPHKGPQPIERTVGKRMPVEASREVYSKIRAFLNNVNLDLGPELEPYDGGEDPGI